MFGVRREYGSSLIVALLLIVLSGCANLRLPAIDPSGRRLFLPNPNYTTLTAEPRCPLLERFTSTGLGSPGPGSTGLDGPAFQSPPDIPDCETPASSQPYTTAALDPKLNLIPADPVAPRIVVPGVCQDPTTAADDSTRGCLGQTRSPSNPQSLVSLSPRQQVAMVGTEVLMVAGVCDGDGYYRMREPLEWALSQGSVGHFVEPGQPVTGRLGLRGSLARMFTEPLPELLSNNYAVGCTSKRTQVLTRGTVVTSDDVIVQKGQGWLGVSSPVEGTSYVTVMAPDLDGWTQRSQTAVIHWIDGQWTLPPSAIIQGNQPHVLTTTVSRQASGAPAAGYLVRYQILDPTAVFDNGTTTREVITDANGQASVQIMPATEAGGSARVQVDVIRPARSDLMDRLTIGQGVSTVTWTSSQLGVQIRGPESLNLNASGTYQIEVSNPSSIAATDVLLRTLIPAGFELLSAAPQPSAVGNRLDWNIGRLGPGESRTVDVTYQAIQSGSVQHCTSVQGTSVTPVEDCLTTNVTADALYIEMLGPNPDRTLAVGQDIVYEVTVTNRGDRTLTDVVLSDRFDPGLSHAIGSSPVDLDIARLEPGESRNVGLRFRIEEPGRHCHTLEATATGTPPARTSACVTAEQPTTPPPSQASTISLRKTVQPRQLGELIVGQEADFYLTVENNGNVPLTNVTIEDMYDPEFRLLRAEPQQDRTSADGKTFQWYLSRLDPGESRTFQVTCEALMDVRDACSRGFVRTADGFERTDLVCLPILPARSTIDQPGRRAPGLEPDDPPDAFGLSPGAASPLPGSDGRPRGATPLPGDDFGDGFGTFDTPGSADGQVQDTPAGDVGNLDLFIDGRGARWQVGDLIEYEVIIDNQREVADSDVQITIELPRQVKLEEYTGPVSADEHSLDWREMRMKEIQTIRPGEKLVFVIRATVVAAGQLTARATVRSDRTPDGIAREDVAVADPQ